MNWQKKINLHAVISKGNKKYGLEDAEDWDAVPLALREELAQELENAGDEKLGELACWLRDCETVGELNGMLDEVFDYCDKKKIWCRISDFN